MKDLPHDKSADFVSPKAGPVLPATDQPVLNQCLRTNREPTQAMRLIQQELSQKNLAPGNQN